MANYSVSGFTLRWQHAWPTPRTWEWKSPDSEAVQSLCLLMCSSIELRESEYSMLPTFCNEI